MSDDVTIRELHGTDRDAVIGLMWDLNRFENTLSGDRATDRAAARACFQDDLDKMQPLGGAQFVAERDGKVVGYVCCAITEGGPFIRDDVRTYGYVTTLVVAESARRLGIGEALMMAAEGFTAGQGLRSFAVGHVAGNEGAARLYERLGLKAHAIERVKWLD
jgi:ribosomal protein S18 acetylase RimI-like enzyme